MNDVDPLVVDDLRPDLRPLCLACHAGMHRPPAHSRTSVAEACIVCGYGTCYRVPVLALREPSPAQQSLPPSTTTEQEPTTMSDQPTISVPSDQPAAAAAPTIDGSNSTALNVAIHAINATLYHITNGTGDVVRNTMVTCTDLAAAVLNSLAIDHDVSLRQLTAWQEVAKTISELQRELELAQVRESELSAQLAAAIDHHEIDIAMIGQHMIQEAEDRGWCEKFDDIIDELNDGGLFVKLPTRRVPWDVAVVYQVELRASVQAATEDEALDRADRVYSRIREGHHFVLTERVDAGDGTTKVEAINTEITDVDWLKVDVRVSRVDD